MIKVIKLENAFGIKKINFNIGNDIEENLLIYSPNGTFKTSFTKTLKRISDGDKPEDLIFNASTQYEVHMESKVFKQNNLDTFEEIIFYSQELNKGRNIIDSDFSVLVANDEAKGKYLKKSNEYKNKLKILTDSLALKFYSKTKKDKESQTLNLMSESFDTEKRWESVINEIAKNDFQKLDFPYKYKEIFDDSLFSVINEGSFINDVGVYLDTIASKIDSKLFKGRFGPARISKCCKIS